MKLTIIGQGYVGSSLGLAAFKKSHNVVGIDNSVNRVRELQNLNYKVTTDYSQMSDSEIIVIAVPTPLDEFRNPDLTFLKAASLAIRKYARSGTLVINESTSYPGTLRNFISPILGPNFELAVAPERIDPSNSDWNVENTPRIVGGLSSRALDLSVTFYQTITEKVIRVSSPEVAEAAKLLENTFRQVNIAFVNEFAQIADALKISTSETLEAAATKPFGFMSFMPSIGVGGHCIPIDPVYLSYAAKEVGFKARFIDLADEVNDFMPEFILSKIQKKIGLKDKLVQIAGIAYKSNTSDIRESPAIKLIHLLRKNGAKVIWNDELVKEFNGEYSSQIQKVDIGIICSKHNYMNFAPWLDFGVQIFDVSISRNTGFHKFL